MRNMSAIFDLTPNELLTTTRAVRRRLDLRRTVDLDLIRECLEVAIQAPSASNLQPWHFVLVTEPERKLALAELYRRAFSVYRELPAAAGNIVTGDPVRDRVQQRVMDSAAYLAEHLQDVPVLVIPCGTSWFEGDPDWLNAATMFGTLAPATWSFCLAARARGLGTAWTTLHLMFEAEAAAVLEIPYPRVRQAALIPVAHVTAPAVFRPAHRAALDTCVHIDRFSAGE